MFDLPRKLALVPLAAALAFTAACSGDAPKQDDVLANDLSLAGQAQPAQQFVSGAELGVDSLRYVPEPAVVEATVPAPARASSARRTATRRVATSSPTRRRSAPARRPAPARDQGAWEGSSGGVYESPAPAPAPTRTETVRHTKRDAAIGAAAGAVLGASTSRDRVKGAVIGAAAGGLLGAIIGHNVDKSTRTVPAPPPR